MGGIKGWINIRVNGEHFADRWEIWKSAREQRAAGGWKSTEFVATRELSTMPKLINVHGVIYNG